MKSKELALLRQKITAIARGFVLGSGVFVVLMIVWELSSRYEIVEPQFFSSPSEVFKTGIALINDGSLGKHIAASGKIFATGYLIAAAVGIPAGIILGWFKRANELFGPFVAAMYTTPRIALMPLFIIWFGLGFSSKVALVFLSAVFPIIVNMTTAMEGVDPDLITVAKSYKANRWQIFLTIALPLSLPFLITGLRLATGRALLGTITAEIFGGNAGLGYLIEWAGATFQTATVFVGITVLAATGILMDRAWLIVNSYFGKWRRQDS